MNAFLCMAQVNKKIDQNVLLQLCPIWEQWDKYCRIWCSGHLNNCDDHLAVISGGQKEGAVEGWQKRIYCVGSRGSWYLGCLCFTIELLWRGAEFLRIKWIVSISGEIHYVRKLWWGRALSWSFGQKFWRKDEDDKKPCKCVLLNDNMGWEIYESGYDL